MTDKLEIECFYVTYINSDYYGGKEKINLI